MIRCTKCGNKFGADETPFTHACPLPADVLEGKTPPVADVEPVVRITAVRPVTDPDYCPEPALTPEMWLTHPRWGQFQHPPTTLPNVFEDQHGTAAACLFGNPFGFDIQDALDEVRAAELIMLALSAGAPDPDGELEKVATRAISRGRRIKALLPPTGGG